jgi:hypothetical protein
MNTNTSISQDTPANCSYSATNINFEIKSNLINQNCPSKILGSSIKKQSTTENTDIIKLHLAQNEKATYRKSYIAWDDIERANKPKSYTDKTKHLGKNSKAVLSVIIQKLRKKSRILLNHKYISTITRCERRQNQNIIKELSHILDINYYNSFTNPDNDKKYRYCYEFTLKELEQIDIASSADLNKSIEQKITHRYIYKENKIINNRSNKSNFCKSNFNLNSRNTKLESNKQSESLVTTEPTSVNDSRTREHREEVKVVTTTHNGFLNGGKSLKDMLDHLTDEMCSTLRSSCGRDFTDRAIREIVKAVSRSKKGGAAFFYHIKGFIAYLSKILSFEKRDAVKANSTNYYIKANQTNEEQDIQKQEKYLSNIEYSLQVSPEWHLKKKLASVLERSTAYNLLTAYKSLDIKENRAIVHLRKNVELSEMDNNIILQQVQATHEVTNHQNEHQEIKFLELKMPKKVTSFTKRNSLEKNYPERHGIWGKIRKTFASYFEENGEAIDNSWLSKINAKIDSEQKTIELHAPSGFIKDWIENNYLRYIEDAAKINGLKLLGISG